MERQRTVASLAFMPGPLSTESLPHRIAYEELTTTILPRCKHLLTFLQQIHLAKATPSQAVNVLQVLLGIESSIEAMKKVFVSRPGELCTASGGQDTLVERLLAGYPKLSVRLTQLLGEIDVKHAKRNDIERTIRKRISRHLSQSRKYQELSDKLNALADEFESVLSGCRSALGKPSLDYATLRGGSNSDIHHLIEVSRADLHNVPPGWLVVNSTKKVVRFHPREIVQLHVQEEMAKEQKEQLILSSWRQFIAEVDAQIYVGGMACSDILATLDALCSLATVAQSYPNYSRPEFVEDGAATLEIVDGRHPIIETLIGSSYMSNSLLLSSSTADPGSLLVVSGPNMGGKTSLLRMCALIVILAQMGSFVPAASVRLSVFDGVYTLMHRSPASYNVQLRNLPSSAQELTSLGWISRNASKKSLVLLDEIGFGMTTQVAESIAVAQMRYLVEIVGCHVVFATHLTAAIQKLQLRLGCKCQTKQLEYQFYAHEGDMGSALPEQQITFHYTLRDGIASDSFALETARRAGIDAHILQRAQDIQEDL